MTTKPPFNVRMFIQAIAKRAAAMPEHAAVIYAEAAERLRKEALRPENASVAPTLASLAAQLVSLSAQTTVPPMGLSGDISPRPAPAQYTKSDLDDIVKDMEEAKRGPNGEHLDDLIAEGRFSQMQKDSEQAATGAKPVNFVPPSALSALTGATALCQYGGSVTNASGNTSLSPVTGTQAYQETAVVKWDGAPGEMQTVTVDGWIQTSGSSGTYPAGTNSAGTFYSYRPFLHVFFGSARGTPAEAFIDIGRGCQFSVATNFLTVNVGMDKPSPANPTEVAGSMQLGASMGFRQTGHQAPLLRTVYIDNQPGNGTIVNYLIPLFASRLEAFITPTPANWTLSMRTLGSNTLSTIAVSQLSSNAVVLPGNAWSIAVANNGVANDSAQLVFSLLL